MTPRDIIIDADIQLKERLKKEVADLVQDHVQNFIDKTGVMVNKVSFSFLDVSTLDKRRVTFHYIEVDKISL